MCSSLAVASASIVFARNQCSRASVPYRLTAVYPIVGGIRGLLVGSCHSSFVRRLPVGGLLEVAPYGLSIERSEDSFSCFLVQTSGVPVTCKGDLSYDSLFDFDTSPFSDRSSV